MTNGKIELKIMKDEKLSPDDLQETMKKETLISNNDSDNALCALCSRKMSKLANEGKTDEKRKFQSVSTETAIQTEEYSWLQTLIEKVVKTRMKAYQKASESSEKMDEKLSPLLKRLKHENRELRDKADLLKQKLEAIEKLNSKKRTATGIQLQGSPAKRIQQQPSTPLFPTPQQQRKTPVTTPPFTGAVPVPMSFTPPVRSMYLPPGTHPSQQPQQYFQILPNGQQQRFVLQPTYPPGSIPASGGGGEGYMVIDPSANNSNQNPQYNIGTQVVMANPGLRMASSHPKDINIRQPLQQMSMNAQPFGTSPMIQQQQQRFQSHGGIPRPPTWVTQQQPRPQMAIAHRQPLPIQQNIVSPPTSKLSAVPSNQISNTTPPSKPSNLSSTTSNEARLALPFNMLPKLKASISASGNGIILTWDYDNPCPNPEKFKVECYQLFAHQAKGNIRPPAPNEARPWKKIGVVNALPLPMACTLTQFATGNVYYFAVVAVDIHGREGEMSNPCTIRLNVNS